MAANTPALLPADGALLPASCERASSADEGLFTSAERAAMQEAWAAVTTVDPTSPDAAAAAQAKRQELGGAFIALMFTDHPHLMQLFTFARGARAGEVDPVRMKVHGSKTIGAVDAIVGHVARGDDAELIRMMDALIKRHLRYQVLLEHYDQVLGTLAKFVSGALQSMGKWDDLQATAWGKFVDATKGLAIKVYAEQGSASSGA